MPRRERPRRLVTWLSNNPDVTQARVKGTEMGAILEDISESALQDGG